jgi:DNA relaxase NicK
VHWIIVRGQAYWFLSLILFSSLRVQTLRLRSCLPWNSFSISFQTGEPFSVLLFCLPAFYFSFSNRSTHRYIMKLCRHKVHTKFELQAHTYETSLKKTKISANSFQDFYTKASNWYLHCLFSNRRTSSYKRPKKLRKIQLILWLHLFVADPLTAPLRGSK